VKGFCSAFEGQVILQIQYPLGYEKAKFEDDIRSILTAKTRTLLAWQKLTDGEIGTFVLVAEFHDTSHAKLAVQELHGTVIGVSDICVLIYSTS
jgi:hypothetical protein